MPRTHRGAAPAPPITEKQQRKGVPPRRRHRAEMVNVSEQRARCLDLRRRGLSYPKIAAVMGISISTAFNNVNAELIALREQTEADAYAVRDVELQRCDEMTAALWPRVAKGDVPSISAALKVMERRASLLGLDAPASSIVIGAMTAITPEQISKMSFDEIEIMVRSLMNRITISTPGRPALPDISVGPEGPQ